MTTKWTTRAFSKLAAGGDIPIDESLLDEYVVILMQGKNHFGDRVYSYLRITLRNLKNMKSKLGTGEIFSPSDFGEVVAAGRGDPTEEVKAEIAMTYKHQAVDAGSTGGASTASAPPAAPKAWDEY